MERGYIGASYACRQHYGLASALPSPIFHDNAPDVGK
jgi:hypothetical protein